MAVGRYKARKGGRAMGQRRVRHAAAVNPMRYRRNADADGATGGAVNVTFGLSPLSSPQYTFILIFPIAGNEPISRTGVIGRSLKRESIRRDIDRRKFHALSARISHILRFAITARQLVYVYVLFWIRFREL